MPSVRHHFLPQTYLRRFTLRNSRKTIWVCDKLTYSITASTPRDSGCEDYYHAFTREDGTLDTDSVESELNRIETTIDRVYEAFRMARMLTPDEMADFLMFAGLMMVRVPHFVSTIDDFLARVAGMAFEMSKGSPNVLKQLKDYGFPVKVGDDGQWAADRGKCVLLSLSNMDTTTKILAQMNWQFLRATDESFFIAGDNPVSYSAPGDPKTIYGVGIYNRHIEVTFPMSKTICAFGGWKPHDSLYRTVDTATVREVNRRTANAARRYMYGPRNNPNDFCSAAEPVDDEPEI